MEGEKMVKKSKVGSTGRFGARYGRKAKRTVKDIEDKMHAKHVENVAQYLLVEHTFLQHQWEKLQNVTLNV